MECVIQQQMNFEYKSLKEEYLKADLTGVMSEEISLKDFLCWVESNGKMTRSVFDACLNRLTIDARKELIDPAVWRTTAMRIVSIRNKHSINEKYNFETVLESCQNKFFTEYMQENKTVLEEIIAALEIEYSNKQPSQQD
jgi:hypothetical protein